MTARRQLSVGVMSRTQMVRSPWEASPFTLVNFTASRDRLSPLELMDSAFATPARYAAEMVRRLQSHAPAEAYLVINPRFDFSPESVNELVAAARTVAPGPDYAMLVDVKGRVAAMLLRQPVADEDVLVLSALSAVDSNLDMRFLQSAFDWKGVWLSVPQADGGEVDSNGFLIGSFNPHATALPATLGLEALAHERLQGASPEQARRRLLHVAVLPFHAGDVLFLCQALQALPPYSVGAVLVLRDFEPIVRECLPWVRVIAVDAAVPSRQGFIVPDEQGFLAELVRRARAAAAREGEPLHGIFHLLRPHRDYARSHFHLRQALWFTLGGAGATPAEAELWPPERSQRRGPRCTADRRERVVVHFDGGWELKSYPREWRQPLLRLLREAGFRPVVLGPEEPGLSGCDFTPFRDLAGLRALVDASAAVIGPDSFPAHYAVHRGVPTLHLFASTHPRNSTFPDSPLSRTLHHPLPCVPCGAPTYCKLDEGRACRAAPTPHAVLEALLQLVGPPSRDAELGEVAEPQAQLELAARDLALQPPPPGRRLPDKERQRQVGALFRSFHLEEVAACPLCGSGARQPLGEPLGVPVARCEGCGLWYARRRVREEERPRWYEPGNARQLQLLQGQPTGPERYGYEYARALGQVAWLKRLLPGGRALDVDCGLGALVRRLAEHGFEAEGLELPAMAALARRYSGGLVHSELQPAPRHALVTCSGGLERSLRPREYMASLVAHLAPAGTLAIEALRTDCASLQAQGLQHEAMRPLEHLLLFQEAHLRALMEEAGLRVMEVLYPDGVEHPRICLAARLPG